MGVSQVVVKKGVYSGGMGRFCEGRISKGGGGYILGRCGRFSDRFCERHIQLYKRGYILERKGRFWERHFM